MFHKLKEVGRIAAVCSGDAVKSRILVTGGSKLFQHCPSFRIFFYRRLKCQPKLIKQSQLKKNNMETLNLKFVQPFKVIVWKCF